MINYLLLIAFIGSIVAFAYIWIEGKKDYNEFVSFVILMSLFGCNNGNRRVKSVSFIDNLFSFSVIDDDNVVYEFSKRGKENVNIIVNGYEYRELKKFEEDSFSSKAMYIIKESNGNEYENFLDYFNSVDFENTKWVMFSDVDGYNTSRHKNFINNSHKKISYNGNVIGEELFFMGDGSLPISISYNFLFVTKQKLVSVVMRINSFGDDISGFQNMLEKKGDAYYWKSKKDQEQFFFMLEGRNRKSLPQNIQLLWETKELFLKTLKINE